VPLSLSVIGQPYFSSKEPPLCTVCNSWSVCFEQDKNVCPSWDQEVLLAAFSKGCSKYYGVVGVVTQYVFESYVVYVSLWL